MTNALPENESPVHLRSSAQLSVRRIEERQAAAPGPLAAPLAEATTNGESLPVPAIAATGLALLLAGGWLLKRRQRMARPPQPAADPVVAEQVSQPGPQAAAEPAPAPQPGPAREPEPVAGPVSVAPPVDLMAQVAAELAEEPDSLQPRQTFPGPLEHSERPARLLSVRAQKRLIKWLLWVRTVAGGVAILAAIAIVVFWAIETIDRRSGESGLTRPLLVLLLAGWGASWGAGQLANQLHRAFFGRVHPKFDN